MYLNDVYLFVHLLFFVCCLELHVHKTLAKIINDCNNTDDPIPPTSTSSKVTASSCEKYPLLQSHYCNESVVTDDGLNFFLLAVLWFVNQVVSQWLCVEDTVSFVMCHKSALVDKMKSFQCAISLQLYVFAVHFNIEVSCCTVEENACTPDVLCVKSGDTPSASMLFLHCCMVCLLYYRYCVSCLTYYWRYCASWLMYYWCCDEEFCTFWRYLSSYYYFLQQLMYVPACHNVKHLVCGNLKNVAVAFMPWPWLLYEHCPLVSVNGCQIKSMSGNGTTKGNPSTGGSSSGNTSRCTGTSTSTGSRGGTGRLVGNSGGSGSHGDDDDRDDPNQRWNYAHSHCTPLEYEEDSTTDDGTSSSGSVPASKWMCETQCYHDPFEYTTPIRVKGFDNPSELHAFAATSPVKGGPPVSGDVRQLYPAEIAPQVPTCDVSYSPSKKDYHEVCV